LKEVLADEGESWQRLSERLHAHPLPDELAGLDMHSA
jgi:hypothetical protein